MSDDEKNSGPSWKDYEYLASYLGRVIRSHTHATSLLDAKINSLARAQNEGNELVRSLRNSASSSEDVRVVAAKLAILVENVQEARAGIRDTLVESRGTNEKLGVTREEIGALRIEMRTHTGHTPPQGTLAYNPPVEEPDEIAIRDGKIHAQFGVGAVWSNVKRFGPVVGWLSGLGTVAYHAVKHWLGF